MGQKFSMTAASGAAQYSIEPDIARPAVDATAQQAGSLSEPMARTKNLDAPPDVPALVAGAVEAFFEERRQAVDRIKDRALAVTDAGQQALAAYDAGDEEMATGAIALASRSGARHLDNGGS